MPFLALTHLPIAFSNGWVVGLAAMLVAAVTTVPLAHLYERGAATIWAAALVHAAIDFFRVVTSRPWARRTFSLYVSAIALVVPLLVFPLARLARPRLAGDRPPAAGGRTSSP